MIKSNITVDWLFFMLKFNYFSINHIDLHTYTGENFDSEKRNMCNFFIFLIEDPKYTIEVILLFQMGSEIWKFQLYCNHDMYVTNNCWKFYNKNICNKIINYNKK